MRKRITVTFERDERGWLARVPDVQGCHTWGRTIREARANIREALAACDAQYKDAQAVGRLVTFIDDVR
jgi:predicted RNase H-like HicB family nuclease